MAGNVNLTLLEWKAGWIDEWIEGKMDEVIICQGNYSESPV